MGFYVLGRVVGCCRFFTCRTLSSCIRSATSRTLSSCIRSAISGTDDKLGGGRMMSTTLPSLMLPPVFGVDGKAALYLHNYEAITINTINSEKLEKDKWDEVYFAGSSHGWLFAHNRVKHDVFMLNPINGRHIKLPPLHAEVSRVALSCSPDNDDDDDCRAMIIFGGGRLAFCVPGRSTEWTPIGISKTDYADTVYSSKHNRFFCIPTRYLSALRCWGSWGFGEYTELEVWDMSEAQCPRLDEKIGYDGDTACPDRQHNIEFWPMLDSKRELIMACWHIKYLVAHGDDLYVVVRYVNPRMRDDKSCAEATIYISKYRGWDLSYPYKTILFDIFKIDWRGSGHPVYMDGGSLEGLAMFVGTNQSRAQLVSDDHPKLKPDSIYFSDEHRFIRKSRAFADTAFGGHDNGIFDYQNGTFSSCYCGTFSPLNPMLYEDIRRIQPPPLCWFTHS